MFCCFQSLKQKQNWPSCPPAITHRDTLCSSTLGFDLKVFFNTESPEAVCLCPLALGRLPILPWQAQYSLPPRAASPLLWGSTFLTVVEKVEWGCRVSAHRFPCLGRDISKPRQSRLHRVDGDPWGCGEWVGRLPVRDVAPTTCLRVWSEEDLRRPPHPHPHPRSFRMTLSLAGVPPSGY